MKSRMTKFLLLSPIGAAAISGAARSSLALLAAACLLGASIVVANSATDNYLNFNNSGSYGPIRGNQKPHGKTQTHMYVPKNGTVSTTRFQNQTNINEVRGTQKTLSVPRPAVRVNIVPVLHH